MGVKSTRTITRAEAERRYVDLHVRRKTQKRRDKADIRIRDAGEIGRPYLRDVDLDHLDERTLVEIYHHVDARMRKDEWTREAKIRLAGMDDEELENDLERLNDIVNDGEGYENYIIKTGQDD